MAGAPLRFAVPVWGSDYVATFLNYSLPSQLASGNIPSLADLGGGHSYTIYTAAEDREHILGSAAVEELRRHLPVAVRIIAPPVDGAAKYDVKTACYREALRDAAEASAALVAANADIIMADGFVRAVYALITAGRKIIELPAPRAVREALGPELAARRDGAAIAVGPAELSQLWLRHRHPQLRMHEVDGPPGEPFQPSHLYWSVGDEGVIIRAFHLYPMVVRPSSAPIDFRGTIDDDLAACYQVADHERHVADDSAALFCCELSTKDYSVSSAIGRGDLNGYVRHYASSNHANLSHLDTRISISGGGPPSALWLRRSAESDACVARLKAMFRAQVLGEALAEDPDEAAAARLLSKAERALLDRMAAPNFTLAEGLSLYTSVTGDGRPFPLRWEARILELGLVADPSRADLQERLGLVERTLQRRARLPGLPEAFVDSMADTEFDQAVRLVDGAATAAEGLALYATLQAQGVSFPLLWEERLLDQLLRDEPDRPDLIQSRERVRAMRSGGIAADPR